MSTHYASNLRIAHGWGAQFGLSNAEWHRAAMADTGTSHMKLARAAVVQCEWCDEVFIAATMREAMAMFRTHEEAMVADIPSEEVES